MHRDLPLQDLTLSLQNVRRTPPTDAEQSELIASIQCHGLLENLVVRPCGSGYAVIAGGRRLMALQALAQSGHIAQDFAVPCRVHEGDALEVSLAENVQRVAMHPLDEFEAFTVLADDGLDMAQIAQRFGCTERLVNQRLRLGRVAEEIREAYRQNKIPLSVLMAFTVTDDPATQMTVWSNIRHDGVSAWQVRRLLNEDRLAVSSRFVQFIGMEAYEAAGGTVSVDLFNDGHDAEWLDNRALVMDLAGTKLEQAARTLQDAEGWSWAEPRLEIGYGEINAYGRVRSIRADPTPEQAEEMDRLTAELGRIEAEADDSDEWPEDLGAHYEIAEARLDDLRESLLTYAADDLARAGCLITIQNDGSLLIQRGLVRKEDAQPTVSDDDREGDGGDAADTTPSFSAALCADLGYNRLGVTQRHLAQDFACAFDLMLFTLARQALDPARAGYQDLPMDIDARAALPHQWVREDEARDLPPPEIDLGWLERAPAEGFRAMAALSSEDKERLFAWCAARTLRGGLKQAADDGPDDLQCVIASRLGIDMAAHWRPTAGAFFRRISKGHALAIAEEVLGRTWARAHQGEKKGVLADLLESIFQGERRPGVSATGAQAALRWLPDGMAYGDIKEDSPEIGTDDGADERDPEGTVLDETSDAETDEGCRSPDIAVKAIVMDHTDIARFINTGDLPEAFQLPAAE